MDNATQTNTQKGDLPFLANEDLTGCEGYLVKLVNDAGVAKVALPDGITDLCPFVLIEAADIDELVSVRPLEPGRNVRLKLYGTCNPGDVLIPNADGSHDGQAYVKPDSSSACFEAAVAEQIGVSGQLVLARPLLGHQYATTAHFLGNLASDPTGTEGDFWYNTTTHLLKFKDNSAVRVIGYVATLVVMFALAALFSPNAGAADVTPAKVTGTNSIGSVGAGDNAKFAGTLEVTGTSLHTGVATFTAAPVFTDASASRTALGLAIGTNVQAYDADLTTYAGITPAANIQSLLGCADYSAARTALSLVPGTNVQAYDADLLALAGVTSAANAIPYFTGSGTAGVISSSANVVTFLAAANNAAMADIIGGAFTEGDIADSTVLSADIKNGEIVDADVNASAAIANTKLAVPAVRTVTQTVAVAEFTDGLGTSGYLDMSSQIPAQAIVLGWKANVTSGFAGDTTAVMEVGKSGDTDCFSADTAQSVFGVAKVGSNALAAAAYTTAATTVRVTVTGGADFTTIKTANTAAATITVYYLQTE